MDYKSYLLSQVGWRVIFLVVDLSFYLRWWFGGSHVVISDWLPEEFLLILTLGIGLLSVGS